jgi:hypothetical protein
VEDGDFLCDDIDECEDEELFECDEGYECENKAGGYDCVDIDECETDNGGCSELRDCLDSDGSFSCDECPEGWDEDGDFDCVNVDECEDEELYECEENFVCDDNDGGYDCVCEESLTECVEGACVDTETDPEFCGDCETACDEGASCEGGECLSVGLLAIKISWDVSGEGDLFVTTPNGNTISYLDPGPLDGGELEVDNAGFGPENIFWPVGNTPPTGTYFVCWNPWDFFVGETVNVTATVSIPGEEPFVFMQERSTDYTVETCSDMTSSFLFSFDYPPPS